MCSPIHWPCTLPFTICGPPLLRRGGGIFHLCPPPPLFFLFPSSTQKWGGGDVFARKYKHPDGKFLIIGGGIANFTDVAATFTGLIKALQEYADDIKERCRVGRQAQKSARFEGNPQGPQKVYSSDGLEGNQLAPKVSLKIPYRSPPKRGRVPYMGGSFKSEELSWSVFNADGVRGT